MQHPFAALEPEYAHLLATAKVTRSQVVARGVDEIERVLGSYDATATASGIPAAWIGPTDCRESDCNPRCGIGQGDPWSRVSVHVPRGEGPFASKAAADKYYLHYDKIDVLEGGATSWSLPYACWCWERWNGFGPRAHGRISGYLFSCTDVYDTHAYGGHGLGGKYVADGVWDGDKLDPQPGAVALYLVLIRRHPELAIPGGIAPVVAPPLVPAAPPMGVHDAEALQAALNALGADPPLDVDGNLGRMTRRAVEAFQTNAGLEVDGLAGPATWAAIAAQLPPTA
jgi:lysozyme family protein